MSDTVHTRFKAVLGGLRHPVITIGSALASIVSVPLAFYFYFASIRYPALTYYFHPVRSSIVSAGAPTALSVSYEGVQLKGSVFVVQCAIWNEGDAPIRREDILEKVRLRGGSGVRILEATIRQRTREVTGISLNTSSADSGELGIDWDILERNDGAALQVVYEGPVDATFGISGVVVGQKSLRERVATDRSPEVGLLHNKRAQKLVPVGLLFLGISALVFSRQHKTPHFNERMVFCAVALGLTYIVLGVMLAYRYWSRPSPFSF